MKDGFPVSIAELVSAGQRPLPSEAVAIVLDLCRQVMRQTAGASVLRPISTATLFLDASGTVAVTGGVAAEDDQTVLLLGRLLLQILPSEGQAGSGRVPARLRQLAARAAAGDSPRPTVASLAGRLRRFGPEEPQAAIRALFERWRQGGPKKNPQLGPQPAGERRANSPGADVLRRWLREAEEEAYRRKTTPALPVSRRAHRAALGLVAAVLLMLAGLSATYWLRADEERPQVPAPPAVPARQAPATPQPGWELLPDAAGLMVRKAPEPPPATPAPVAARTPAGVTTPTATAGH